jgi:hypothetical protein
VAVQVRELIGLVVYQNEDRVFRTKKRIKAVTRGHQDFLSLPLWTATGFTGDMRQRATLPGLNLLFLLVVR